MSTRSVRYLDTPMPERYPCAHAGCPNRAARVVIVPVKPNGMPASVAFYGECTEHPWKEDPCHR